MILRNEDLINKLGSREVVNETRLLHKIDGRKFYVYVDNKPFKGFDSLAVWNNHLDFYNNDTGIKYDLLDGCNITTRTCITVPFENCFNMSLAIGDETINISDYKRTEDLVEIRKDVLSIGDYIRIHYYGTNHGDYACTGTVCDITKNFIMITIPDGDGLRNIAIFARDLLHDKLDVEIEILHKVENPSNLNEPSSPDDDDDDDSPKYDVITEEEDE
jgi:hypothetical protein